MTNTIASVVIGLNSALKSCHDVVAAASYSIGGRKKRNITSGSRSIAVMPGIKPIASPETTRRMGVGNLYLSPTAKSPTSNVSTTMMVAKFYMKFSLDHH